MDSKWEDPFTISNSHSNNSNNNTNISNNNRRHSMGINQITISSHKLNRDGSNRITGGRVAIKSIR